MEYIPSLLNTLHPGQMLSCSSIGTCYWMTDSGVLLMSCYMVFSCASQLFMASVIHAHLRKAFALYKLETADGMNKNLLGRGLGFLLKDFGTSLSCFLSGSFVCLSVWSLYLSLFLFCLCVCCLFVYLFVCLCVF